MRLSTQQYIDSLTAHAGPEVRMAAAHHLEFTWGEVSKGLCSILLAYLTLLVNCLFVLGMAVWAAYATKKGGGKLTGDASTVAFLAFVILVLTTLGSIGMIVKGKWRCLQNAPERHGAKWWMFASIVCIVSG